MSDILYTREKLGSAVDALATGVGSINDRLVQATEHITRSSRNAFTSPEAQQMHDDLLSGLKAKEITDDQAIALARLIVGLYDRATDQAYKQRE